MTCIIDLVCVFVRDSKCALLVLGCGQVWCLHLGSLHPDLALKDSHSTVAVFDVSAVAKLHCLLCCYLRCGLGLDLI